MSLWEFIQETTKDIEDVATKRAALAEQPLLQQGVVEEEKEMEEEMPALVNKKSGKGSHAEVEWEAAGKQQKKKKAKKT